MPRLRREGGDVSDLCTVREARNTGEDQHCLHDLNGGTEKVCCWCGDLFIGDFEKGALHGRFRQLEVADLRRRIRLARRAWHDLIDRTVVDDMHPAGVAITRVLDLRQPLPKGRLQRGS